jgi:hypothetical protein
MRNFFFFFTDISKAMNNIWIWIVNWFQLWLVQCFSPPCVVLCLKYWAALHQHILKWDFDMEIQYSMDSLVIFLVWWIWICIFGYFTAITQAHVPFGWGFFVNEKSILYYFWIYIQNTIRIHVVFLLLFELIWTTFTTKWYKTTKTVKRSRWLNQ